MRISLELNYKLELLEEKEDPRAERAAKKAGVK